MAWSLTAIAFIALYLAACWLLGAGLLARLGAGQAPPAGAGLTAVAVGYGCSALLLFALALAGQLRPAPILAVFVPASALGAWWLTRATPGGWRVRGQALAALAGRARRHPVTALAIVFIAAAVVLLAMGAPLEWDELAYHLPYARDYATAGALVVDESLRYPLHAHHVQLLYAAALLFASEAAAHLVHAAAGALLVAGVYVFTRDAFGRATAVIAALLCLAACHDLADTALVDLGLAMFVFYAFLALAAWQRGGPPAWLLISAFLLAMAVSTKYQGLLQLPLFALALLAATRAPGPWLRVTAVLVLFGTWWYLRNALIAGDPVHPYGAEWFGYWLWDSGDLAGQYADVARYRHHLPPVLLPALAAIALPIRRDPVGRTLLILGIGGLLAWYLTSRYDRYLLPTYPFLAILCAHVVVTAWRRLALRRGARHGTVSPGLVRVAARGALGLAVVTAAALLYGERDDVCLSRACVETVWAREFPAWRVVTDVPGFARLRPYQYGLENQLYLLGDDVVGDWYGRYRYRDIAAVMRDPAALVQHLRALGRDSILVARARPGFEDFPAAGALRPQFETLYEDGQIALYRITGR